MATRQAVFVRRRLAVAVTVTTVLVVLVRGWAPAGSAPTSASTPFAGRLLVYGRHALTAAQVDALRAAVPGPVTPVYGGELALASGRPGYPDVLVQAFTVDPRSFATAARSPGLAGSLTAGVVLSRAGAALRHVAVGGVVTLATGRRLPVSAVVDDRLIGGYELATSPALLGGPAGTAASYLLVADGGDQQRTAARLRAALPGTDLRVEARTRNGYLSSADTVLTQAQVKTRFGEFALAVDGSGGLQLDPAWRAAWIVTVRVPQLGTVSCNRGVVDDLRAAMQEITDRGLGALVHTADFQREGGCWNPRTARFGAGALSAHAWGIAVDINVDANPLGAAPHQDPRLVDVMARHGFTWGGRWLRPDGAHFEWVGAGA